MREDYDEKVERYASSLFTVINDADALNHLKTNDSLLYSYLCSFKERAEQELQHGKETVAKYEIYNQIQSLSRITDNETKKRLLAELFSQII